MLRINQLTGFGGGLDTSPPSITSSSSTSAFGTQQLAFDITTNKLCTIAIGGADASHVELVSNTLASVHTLRWLGDGTQDHTLPADADGNNVYAITLTPTDAFSHVGSAQSLNITVTDNWSATDPNFANVVFLAGFESLVTDESSAAHGTSTGGAGFVSADQAKYGSKSLKVIGNGRQWGDSTDWHFAAGNFTVEGFIYQTGDINGTTHFIIGQWQGSGSVSWVMQYNSSQHLVWTISTTGSDVIDHLISSTTMSRNTWYHVCVDFDGTKYRMYVDGVMVASSTTLHTLFTATGTNLAIGSNSSNGNFYFDGYLDEMRITKGVARYASDGGFTVPPGAYQRS